MMDIIWIGDFRLEQIRQHLKKSNYGVNSRFIIEPDADYTWLSNMTTALSTETIESDTKIVLMLGFNDCVYSCAHNGSIFTIGNIANNYTKAMNALAAQYTSSQIYFCSVNPVTAEYFFEPYKDTGKIPKKLLNTKITSFNSNIKSNENVIFLDSFKYLKEADILARDGVRYTSSVIDSLCKYIINFDVAKLDTQAFLNPLRATEADAPNPYSESFKYWRHFSIKGPDSIQGVNECLNIKVNGVETGCTLPNCVGYAWGRFYEITGTRPRLSCANAEDWYDHDDDYERGDTPRVGAVICWRKGKTGDKSDGAGHVAIVETYDANTGIITTSESGYRKEYYNSKDHFWVTKRIFDKTTRNWREYGNGVAVTSWIDSYTFQGFIYPPVNLAPVEKEDLTTKNAYLSEDEKWPNVQYIACYFAARGWTLNAIAGMLGNIDQECTMSPWLWEGETSCGDPTIINADGTHSVNESILKKVAIKLNKYEKNEDGSYKLDSNGNKILKGPPYHIGYGLTQWTPYAKFITWCNNGGKNGNANGTGKILPYWDIGSQLKRIEAEVEISKIYPRWVEGLSQWIPVPEDSGMSFVDFTTSTKSPRELAEIFCNSYERPGTPMMGHRMDCADMWYKKLSNRIILTSSEDTTLRVENFRVEKNKADKITASFVVRNGATYTYTLKQNNKVVYTKKVSEVDDGIETFSITDDSIKPNTKYTLVLNVVGHGVSTITKTETFTTAPEYPPSVTTIKLTCSDKLRTPDSQFSLTITKPTDFGYWKASDCFYEIHLIVNGKSVKNQKTSSLNLKKFSIKSTFGYQCKLGDIIQIGIRVGVSNTNIFDAPVIKTSNTICLLNKPAQMYIYNK